LLKVKLLTRPIKASLALPRLQLNQTIDGLIRLLTDNTHNLMSMPLAPFTYQGYEFTHDPSTTSNNNHDSYSTIIAVVHSQKDLKMFKSLQMPDHAQVLVILLGNYKSQFPANFKVITIPDEFYSLKGSTFAKLVISEFGSTFKQLFNDSIALKINRPD